MAKTTATEKVYLDLHKSFVKQDIPYIDKQTGEERTFNSVTLPKDTVINGKNVGGYEFNPFYVDISKYNPDHRVIPLLADREVWLKKDVLDADGNQILDQDGRPERDTVKVMPQAIKEALSEARKAWSQQHASERSLHDRAGTARNGAEALGHNGNRAAMSRDDIPF